MSQPFDEKYWGPDGPQPAKRWKGAEVRKGAPYKDLGPVVDGQAGAVRKISSGRKHRGSAADDYSKRGPHNEA